LSTRIPVSGIGVVAPGAIGIDAFRTLLSSGRSAISRVDRFDTTGLRAQKAGLVRDFSPRDFIAPMKLRRMNMLSRLGLAAAKLALRDAGVENLDPNTGVAVGTAFGPVQTSVEYMQEYAEKGPALAPPQLFAESVANAPGSHIAIEMNLRGFNVTVTQRESSALAAAMYGASQVLKGAAPAALIGGVEEVNEMLFSVLDRLGALAAGADAELRPFDRRGAGLLIGEGSAVILAGGAPRYASLSGFGIARDRTASISDWGSDPEAVAGAIRGALDDAGIGPTEVDAVYASANGNRRADALEEAALRAVFGSAVPPVVAVKGYCGEYAAAGALQLVAAILAVTDGVLHASCSLAEADPAVGFEIVRESRSERLRHVLVNSLSAGGGVVSAIVSREGA
jgi:3-oxoacyl-[acyl-carrier-protein] synthase II